MKKLLVRLARQSPAMIVAMLALFVALTGTAVATTSALITGAQIKNSSITGADVKNRSLRPIDFRGSVRGPRGLRGLQGIQGIQGIQGPAGAPNPNAVNSDLLDGLDSNDFQKVPTAVQHYVIPGSTLIDDDSSGRADHLPTTNVGWCTRSGGGGSNRLYAPVHLPQGAAIVRVRADYEDDAGTTGSNGSAVLTRMPLLGQGGTYNDLYAANYANTATPGAEATGVDDTPSVAGGNVIDNSKWSYNMILVGMPAGMAACSIDVEYTVSPGFAAAAVEPAAGSGNAPLTLP